MNLQLQNLVSEQIRGDPDIHFSLVRGILAHKSCTLVWSVVEHVEEDSIQYVAFISPFERL